MWGYFTLDQIFVNIEMNTGMGGIEAFFPGKLKILKYVLYLITFKVTLLLPLPITQCIIIISYYSNLLQVHCEQKLVYVVLLTKSIDVSQMET